MPKQQKNGAKPGEVIRTKGQMRKIAGRLRKARTEKKADEETPVEREQRILSTSAAWDEL